MRRTPENYYIDTQGIPTDSLGKRLLWTSSVGCEMPFEFNNISGKFKIQEVYRKNTKTYLVLLYNGKTYKTQPHRLLTGYIGWIVGTTPVVFKYNVNDIVGSFKIVNRNYDSYKYNKLIKWYECECINCKTHCDRTEYELNKSIGCPVCSNVPKKVVKGVNDIATTDPWMIPYFADINDAYTHTNQSGKKVYMQCPFCKKKSDHKVIISNLYKHKGFGCSCSDGISFPNKIAFEMLKQLEVQNLEREYSPQWVAPRRFDFYFEYNNIKYILEMDGGIGHGNIVFGTNEKDVNGLLIDKQKDKLAKEHGIIVVRIDCKISTTEYIKKSIYNSQLNDIFDLQKINWEECEKYARTNLIKEVCSEYESDLFISAEELAEKYSLDYRSILSYISIGKRLGWINSKKNDKIRLRCVSEKIRPILVNDKYYFSCVSSFEENCSSIFNIEHICLSHLANKLKNNNGSCEYKGLSIKNVLKDELKEKYRNNYKYLYL